MAKNAYEKQYRTTVDHAGAVTVTDVYGLRIYDGEGTLLVEIPPNEKLFQRLGVELSSLAFQMRKAGE